MSIPAGGAGIAGASAFLHHTRSPSPSSRTARADNWYSTKGWLGAPQFPKGQHSGGSSAPSEPSWPLPGSRRLPGPSHRQATRGTLAFKVTPVKRMVGTPSTGQTPALPEKQPSASRPPGVGTRAGGRCRHLTRSSDTAWPHSMPYVQVSWGGASARQLGGGCGEGAGASPPPPFPSPFLPPRFSPPPRLGWLGKRGGNGRATGAGRSGRSATRGGLGGGSGGGRDQSGGSGEEW